MTSGRTSDAAPRRLLLPALAAAGLLALGACGSDPVPGGGGYGGGGGTGGSAGTDWPEPYGTELDAEAVHDFCGVNTNQVSDTYISYDANERQQAGSWGFADGSGGQQGAGPTTAAGPGPVQASGGTRTMVPGQPGAITDVTVETVSEPTDPTFAVDITLAGPDDEAEYTAEYAHVSFLSVDSEQAWVGFPLVDDELRGRVDFDEPITVTSEGATGRLEVVPVACPTGDGTWTVEPLPDGDYELSIYGTADALGEVEPDDDPGYSTPVFGVWGQERTRVTVADGVISGIGYDGENAYDNW
ncbi:MAG: hypothetical protein ACTH0C_07075 [Actinomycetaceae bacterium]